MTTGSVEKIDSFLSFIEQHFLLTALSEGMAASCTATCLLLFSAADAIGSAFHPSGKPSNRDRFEWTFSQLGKEYQERSNELWILRNSLVHEALNTSAFLSQVPNWGHAHLDLTRDGKLLLHSRQMTNDFCDLVNRLKLEVQICSPTAIAANDRLEWSEELIDQRSMTTPPPPIRVRYVKHR